MQSGFRESSRELDDMMDRLRSVIGSETLDEGILDKAYAWASKKQSVKAVVAKHVKVVYDDLKSALEAMGTALEEDYRQSIFEGQPKWLDDKIEKALRSIAHAYVVESIRRGAGAAYEEIPVEQRPPRSGTAPDPAPGAPGFDPFDDDPHGATD